MRRQNVNAVRKSMQKYSLEAWIKANKKHDNYTMNRLSYNSKKEEERW